MCFFGFPIENWGAPQQHALIFKLYVDNGLMGPESRFCKNMFWDFEKNESCLELYKSSRNAIKCKTQKNETNTKK